MAMRLCHPPDGSTSPKYKLLCFMTTKKEKNALAFNRDRCCHLVLCLRLIPFHCTAYTSTSEPRVENSVQTTLRFFPLELIILLLPYCLKMGNLLSQKMMKGYPFFKVQADF